MNMGLKKTAAPTNQNKVHYNRHCFTTSTTMATPTATQYSWCSASPSVTVQLTDPSLSYPGKCLAQDQRTGNFRHIDNLDWVIGLPFDVELYNEGADTVVMSTAGVSLAALNFPWNVLT